RGRRRGAEGVRQGAHRPLQDAAGGGVHRGAAPHRDRQAAAVQTPRERLSRPDPVPRAHRRRPAARPVTEAPCASPASAAAPACRYLAAQGKRLAPAHRMVVYERNAAGDAVGFGVVLSDETLGGIEHADPDVYAALAKSFARWDDIDVHYRGATVTSGGHGFSAVDRRRQLGILRDRCAELGVELHFRTEAPPLEQLERDNDGVVAADGANSAVRTAPAGHFGTALDHRACRYMWLGTDLVFDALNFHVLETPYGVMQAHAYPYSERE